jgi:hypothetical protein
MIINKQAEDSARQREKRPSPNFKQVKVANSQVFCNAAAASHQRDQPAYPLYACLDGDRAFTKSDSTFLARHPHERKTSSIEQI